MPPVYDIDSEIDDELKRIARSGPGSFGDALTLSLAGKGIGNTSVLNIDPDEAMGRKVASGVVNSVGAVRKSGTKDPYILQAAFDKSRQMLDAAMSAGDEAGIAFWSSQVNGLQEMASDLGLTDDGSGGGGGGGYSSPYDYAQALAGIYNTAINLGVMKSDAAAKALEGALKIAQMTQQNEYLPGYEPGGVLPAMLSAPWASFNPETARYTKVQVPDSSSITDAAEQGFQQALAALTGALGTGSGGGGGGDYGGGGGTSAATEALGYDPSKVQMGSPDQYLATTAPDPRQYFTPNTFPPGTDLGQPDSAPISALINAFLTGQTPGGGVIRNDALSTFSGNPLVPGAGSLTNRSGMGGVPGVGLFGF